MSQGRFSGEPGADHTRSVEVVTSIALGLLLISRGAFMSISPIDVSGGSQFGGSVALSASGRTLIMGGAGDGVGQEVGQGSARVFDWTGTGWQQRGGAITPSDGTSFDNFGSTVAISADGNTACIGGNGDDAGLGSARVFTWDGSGWTQRGGLLRPADASQYERWDRVSLSGDGLSVVVSTPFDDVGANTWQGSAVVFRWDGSAWVQRGDRITRPSSVVDNEDEFWGFSNAINSDGSTIIVGVHSDPVGALQGSARVLDWDGTQWVQRGEPLAPADGELGDGFGASVDLSANGLTAIVGGERDDVGANQDQGSARVFDWSGSAWVQRGGVLTAADGGAYSYFGNSVSLSADGLTAIVGGPRYDVGASTDQGGAVVFDWTGAEWVQRGDVLTPADGATFELFGISVDLSPNGLTAIIGGPDDDVAGSVNQGSARVFAWNGATWVEGGPAISSTISIAAVSASKVEGNSGTTGYAFTATRTGDTSTAQSAAWAITGSGTHAANATDFVGAALPTGTVSFGIGETSTTITVLVAGDTFAEHDEGFTVTLSAPSIGLVIGTAAATGTIINDDLQPGTDGSDTLIGTPQADTLEGLGGNDSLVGLDADDRLDGGAGADTLLGGTGNDVYVVDNTGDRVTEQSRSGSDRVESSISYSLGSELEGLILVGSASIDGVGNSLANQITGNTGNNRLEGGLGDDTLLGGAGADTLFGGAGSDQLTGGNGSDVFRFTSHADSGDVIRDFVRGADRIDLSAIDANTTLLGDQAFEFRGVRGGSYVLPQPGDWLMGIPATKATVVHSYNLFSDTTTIEIDSTDARTDADMVIYLAGRVALQASDFVL